MQGGLGVEAAVGLAGEIWEGLGGVEDGGGALGVVVAEVVESFAVALEEGSLAEEVGVGGVVLVDHYVKIIKTSATEN